MTRPRGPQDSPTCPTLAKSAPRLSPGDTLYHIVEYDPPGEGLHTWRVQPERVTQVRRDQRFSFERFVGPGKIHQANTLGTRFHRTPVDAIRAFRADRRRQIESLRRIFAETDRALAWADAKDDPAPVPATVGCDPD